MKSQLKPPVTPSNPGANLNLPELPSVPSDVPTGSVSGSSVNFDDIDFDDLTRRFEELKKKK